MNFVGGYSSAGEHMTEAHGVRGSTPRVPINLLKKDWTILKSKSFINKVYLIQI